MNELKRWEEVGESLGVALDLADRILTLLVYSAIDLVDRILTLLGENK